MRAGKQKVEIGVYGAATVLTLFGTVLCFAGLLIPHWYNTLALNGTHVVGTARLGLWQDEICRNNTECQTYWLLDDSYVRDENMVFPFWKLIQGIQTTGTAAAVLTLVMLVPFWKFFWSNRTILRLTTYSLFFGTSLIAAFLNVIGCLIISSKGDIDDIDIAPVLSGIGGALFFISVGIACAVCRFDSTYGTLENPVSPKFYQT
uniref:Claudin n=1 Tax=Arion vulgaris TaxID=1028688 RepID=A0A0B7B444_9EUPU